MARIEAKGPGLYNLNIYQSLAVDSLKGGGKSWVRQVSLSQVSQFLGKYLCELPAVNTPSSWESKFVQGDRSFGAVHHSLPQV